MKLKQIKISVNISISVEFYLFVFIELLKRTIAYRHENSGEMSRTNSFFFFSFVSFFGFKVLFYILIT